MPGTQSVPSPFAALLRRSKFATYDSAIGQVYTTHGGHAFRGDWGFKRPLPNRRRNGFITVRSVDSPEQQTEWNSAESSARWMRRWEELGKKLELDEMGSWRSKMATTTWRGDSEFSRGGRRDEVRPVEAQLDSEQSHNLDEPTDGMATRYEASEPNPADNIPNPEAMAPKEFKKYLSRLRALRPEFKQFIKEFWEERRATASKQQLPSERGNVVFTPSGDIHMFRSKQTAPENYVTEFLRRRNKRELSLPSSTRLEQYPHKLAGLEYTYMSTLQSKYLHRPIPGRHIGSNTASRHRFSHSVNKYDLIAAGGIIGAAKSGSHSLMSTDFGTRESPRMDRERGKGFFRMSSVILENPPQTVGRQPQNASDTKLGPVDFRVAQFSNISNPHPLGSPEYVNQVDIGMGRGGKPVPASHTNVVRSVKKYTIPEQQTKSSAELLNTLTHMLPQNLKSNTST